MSLISTLLRIAIFIGIELNCILISVAHHVLEFEYISNLECSCI